MDPATFSHSVGFAGKTKSCKSKAHYGMDALCSEIFRLSLSGLLSVQLLLRKNITTASNESWRMFDTHLLQLAV